MSSIARPGKTGGRPIGKTLVGKGGKFDLKGVLTMVYATNTRRLRAAWLIGAAALIAPAQAAYAQAVEVADETPTFEGDIVVTATRSAQSIQRVPISIQAFTTETLAERQVSNFADYANLLPSVSFSTLGPGRSSLFFRGVSVSGGAFPTAGVYLDEIPLSQAGRLPDVHVYDIERVEALSGPQGTLFGANSLAGTLRIITNKPNPAKFEAGYDVQINKYGKGDFGQMHEGFINMPLSSNVAVRLMGYYRHDGGYIDNVPGSLTYTLADDDPTTNFTIDNDAVVGEDFNSVTEYGFRAAVGIDLDDNWTVTPSITAQYLNAKGAFNFDPDVGDLQVKDYRPTYNKDKWLQASLTIEGKIGDFDIVSATGYFKRSIKNANDYTYYTVTYDSFGPGYESYLQFPDANGNLLDPTQQYFGDIKQSKFTQEIRLTTPKDWLIHFTVGGFYQRQFNEINNDYYVEGLGSIPRAPGVKTAVKRDAFYLTELDQTYKDYAIFAEGSIDISDSLVLTAGIRGFKAKNLSYGFAGVAGGSARRLCGDVFPLPSTPRLTCINNNIPYEQTGETHKVNLTWQVDDRRMLYATYSTGFRPGGGNRIAPNNPYKADTLSNYEVGFKTSWEGGLRLNGAVYYLDWKGVQYGVVPFGFQGAGITVNAGNARIYGVEIDGDYRAGGLTLSWSGAYNDAQLSTNFCNLDPVLRVEQLATCDLPAQIAAAKGTRLPRQPKFKGTASARYEFDVGQYAAFMQGSMFYQTSSTSDLDVADNLLLGNTDGFASFDLSLGAKRGNVSVEFFMQNIFDKRGILSKNTFCSIDYCADSARSFPIRPQFFGLKIGQRF